MFCRTSQLERIRTNGVGFVLGLSRVAKVSDLSAAASFKVAEEEIINPEPAFSNRKFRVRRWKSATGD
jgi:hypothetical protein